MRSEIEDQCSQTLSKSEEDTPKVYKETKVSYPRNLLISLSELDACKRLPSGLDQSILGELGTCATGLSHFCHNSDSSRFHGYLSQHSHPNHECGLLGKGASPQVTSCVSGASVPVVQGSSYHLLKRSNAAYRPPHLCKAKVHLRPEHEDFYNNETFGPSEYVSQERREEERRRRDSFELMRKEQHKAFQGEQNKICDVRKENLNPEIDRLLEASGNSEWLINKYNEPQECATSRSGTSDPAGHDFTAETSGSAFPLPAVLESRSPEMNFGRKSLAATFISEPCDTKRDHNQGYELHSSGLTRQFLGVQNPAGGVSSGYMDGVFEVYTTQNEEVTEQNSTNLSSRNELTQNFLASVISLATDEMSEQLHEAFELSLPSDIDERYSTNYPSVKALSTNYTNGRYRNYSAEHCSSQYLSSEKKGLDKAEMETSSKLNKGSLDKRCFSKIEGMLEDLQTTEYSGIQRYPVGMITRNDILKPHGFLFPDGDNNNNNNIIPSAVDKSESVKLNCEGMMSSSCGKQTLVSKTEDSLSFFDDTLTKVGFDLRSETECKHSHVSDFFENGDLMDEICLPDEDTLITVDDCIVRRNSTSMFAGSSFKANLFTSSSQVDIFNKIASLSCFPIDKRSTQLGLEGPIFDSYDMVSLETSHANLHNQQYYPQFGHCQMNPGKAIFKSSYAEKVQMSSKMRSSDSKTHHYNPQPLHHFLSNVLYDSFQHPHADLSFGHSVNSPLQKQMPVPSKFSSPHQVHGLPRGSTSPRPFHEMTYFGQESHPTQYFPFHYQQQNYMGYEMSNPGHIAGGTGNQAVRSRQMNPQAMAGRGSGIFDKQVDKGF